ncbi:MAG: multiheme c-type cytochrome [Acidobacteriota bacterium]|jgi:hypothetical protein
MNRLGWVAANVTATDLARGLEAFREIAAAAAFPLISANVVFQDTEEPVFEPYVLRSFPWRGEEPLRVAILGLARENPGFLERTADGRKVVLSSALGAAARWVPELAKQADVLVLLSDLPPSQLRSLLFQLPGIDVALAGSGGQVSADVATPPVSSVVYGGDQGKRVGEVRLFFGSQRLVQVTASHVFLDGRYPSDARMKAFEDTANVRINDHYREMAEQEAFEAAELPTARQYVGSGKCSSCHEEAFRVWKESGHAHAMGTLVDRQQEYSPLCVGCHVTGDRKPGGFHNLKATPELADVQCEACHGPGGGHVENPSRSYGSTGFADCVVCHTSENSPEFDPTSYWERIRH